MTTPNNDELREQLAAIEHERWADWQRYMHSLCSKLGDFDTDYALVIPSKSVSHWERQIDTPYAELSEKEKDSDREQVDRYWSIVEQLIATHDKQLLEAILEGSIPTYWSEQKGDVVDAVSVEHIKSVFNKGGE